MRSPSSPRLCLSLLFFPESDPASEDPLSGLVVQEEPLDEDDLRSYCDPEGFLSFDEPLISEYSGGCPWLSPLCGPCLSQGDASLLGQSLCGATRRAVPGTHLLFRAWLPRIPST